MAGSRCLCRTGCLCTRCLCPPSPLTFPRAPQISNPSLPFSLQLVLTKLKQLHGNQYTSKMEGMITDIQTGRDQGASFAQFRERNGISMSTDLQVTMLTTGEPRPGAMLAKPSAPAAAAAGARRRSPARCPRPALTVPSCTSSLVAGPSEPRLLPLPQGSGRR